MSFLLTISGAFAYTRCISPSVCLLKSFMQASTFAPSPFSARASAIRSRTCGRQGFAFLAVSATGGARKPNPSEGGKGATAPCTEISCFEKEDSNERNPSRVRFCSRQLSRVSAARAAFAQCKDLTSPARAATPYRLIKICPQGAVCRIFVLQLVKFGGDFTICLKIHHTDFITFRYYIATLHFHIFLLFSYFFLRTETARRKIGGLFQLAKKGSAKQAFLFLRVRLYFSEKLKSPYAFADGDFFCGNIIL